MTTQSVWLGIDLGTQSVKVVAVTDNGHQVALESRPLDSWRAENVHEQTPEQWWNAVSECLWEVSQQISSSHRISGVSTCATSGTVVAVDRNSGEAASVAIMYDDTRASSYSDIANRVGEGRWRRLGYRIQGSWGLPAMAWLSDHGNLSPQCLFVSQADYINWQLAGQRVASDTSHSLKFGFDLDQMEWPSEVLEALNIPSELMNNVVLPGTLIGRVCSIAAEKTGITIDAPLVAGMTDGSAAQIAAGAVQPGQWNSVLGTTLVLKGASSTRHHDPSGVVYCHRGPFGTGWWPGGASNVGGRAVVSELPAVEPSQLKIDSLTLSQTRVSYPLIGSGERFPFHSPRATGFTLGPPDKGNPKNTPLVFTQIALGVALVERLAYDVTINAGYQVQGPLSFTGGGAKNQSWNQLRSSVLGLSATVPLSSDTAIGVAILARAGVEGQSQEDFYQIVKEMVSVGSVLKPDLALHEDMTVKYKKLVEELARRNWLNNQVARSILDSDA